jgi:TolB-like protein
MELPLKVTAATDPDSIEKELTRILESHTFRRANRMRELLRYAVKGALEGVPASETKAAKELFNKGEDFDPSLDPEVRIQYGRLRRKLAEYYSGEGRNSPIKIDLPPRKYNPVFVANQQSRGLETVEVRNGENGSPEDSRADYKRAIAVLPFANLTNDPLHDVFCYGLTEEIITSLASEPAIDVIASSSAFLFKDKPVDVRAAGEELGVYMVLEGSVRMELDQTRVTAKLARVTDGIAVWSDSFDAQVNGDLSTQQIMARRIVESLPLFSSSPSSEGGASQPQNGV